ncbi:hypothetical protein I8751_15795 [Nostocaceae cyanobacterium CENA357]|uniref:Uncharacterized protein n=1 Tax=Atlanticothrix silvestris CENA357 TaxID=1725252 RepID=A0A8J7HJK5_9CYAN|nr:hypothetical protein [Atlanticothrix silvestris CENA357]
MSSLRVHQSPAEGNPPAALVHCVSAVKSLLFNHRGTAKSCQEEPLLWAGFQGTSLGGYADLWQVALVSLRNKLFKAETTKSRG